MDEDKMTVQVSDDTVSETVEDTVVDAPAPATVDDIAAALDTALAPVMEKLQNALELLSGFSSMVVDAGGEVTDNVSIDSDDPSEPDIIDVPDIEDIDLDL